MASGPSLLSGTDRMGGHRRGRDWGSAGFARNPTQHQGEIGSRERQVGLAVATSRDSVPSPRSSTQRNVSPVSSRSAAPQLDAMQVRASRCLASQLDAIAAERNARTHSPASLGEARRQNPDRLPIRLPTSPKGRRNPQLEP
jgi:hypothetical protein